MGQIFVQVTKKNIIGWDINPRVPSKNGVVKRLEGEGGGNEAGSGGGESVNGVVEAILVATEVEERGRVEKARPAAADEAECRERIRGNSYKTL